MVLVIAATLALSAAALLYALVARCRRERSLIATIAAFRGRAVPAGHAGVPMGNPTAEGPAPPRKAHRLVARPAG